MSSRCNLIQFASDLPFALPCSTSAEHKPPDACLVAPYFDGSLEVALPLRPEARLRFSSEREPASPRCASHRDARKSKPPLCRNPIATSTSSIYAFLCVFEPHLLPHSMRTAEFLHERSLIAFLWWHTSSTPWERPLASNLISTAAPAAKISPGTGLMNTTRAFSPVAWPAAEYSWIQRSAAMQATDRRQHPEGIKPRSRRSCRFADGRKKRNRQVSRSNVPEFTMRRAIL